MSNRIVTQATKNAPETVTNDVANKGALSSFFEAGINGAWQVKLETWDGKKWKLARLYKRYR